MSSNTSLEKLLLEFLAVDSTTGNEGDFANLVSSHLESTGWTVKKQPLKGNEKRFNLFATRGDASPRLILNTHLDTVPPYIAPSQDEKNIYGRGSNDAKGQLACMISAANALVSSHPEFANQIGLLFVVGEEVDHDGMIEANRFHVNPEYLVVGEPTELKFATIQKGSVKVLVKTSGIAGHSGYPSSGRSAIHSLIPILNDILSYDWPKDKTVGDTTLNIGLLKGGQAQNVWATEAEARIYFRVTTSVEDIKKRLENVVNNRAAIEFCTCNDPVFLSATPLPMAVDQVSFNTDLAYYDKLDKLKGKFLFGGGSIKNAHSADEFMPKDELAACEKTLQELAIKILQ